MFFERLCLGRAWTVSVFTFITSPCTWATDRLFAVTFLMIVSAGRFPDFLGKPFFVSWRRVRDLGILGNERNTHLQFRHAFPRCSGEGRGGLDLELSKLMVGSFVQISE